MVQRLARPADWTLLSSVWHCGVGDPNTPIKRSFSLVGHVLDPTTVNSYRAMRQVMDIGPLGVQDGLYSG